MAGSPRQARKTRVEDPEAGRRRGSPSGLGSGRKQLGGRHASAEGSGRGEKRKGLDRWPEGRASCAFLTWVRGLLGKKESSRWRRHVRDDKSKLSAADFWCPHREDCSGPENHLEGPGCASDGKMAPGAALSRGRLHCGKALFG